MTKVKVILSLAQLINKKKCLYINTFNKRNLTNIDKKMLDRSET